MELATSPQINLTISDQDVLVDIATAIKEVVAEFNDITWMMQPADKAVYVHATDLNSFMGIHKRLESVVTHINVSLQKAGKLGKYYCEPDHERHCLDIYYLRY